MGRTPPQKSSYCEKTDHPHTRGENLALIAIGEGLSGPSPHAWGELHVRHDLMLHRRTIPTRVGRTTAPSGEATGAPDHPHTRGENKSAGWPIERDSGPSPHAWGELLVATKERGRPRTIPTRVGRTFSRSRVDGRSSDHPHTRGENLLRPPTDLAPYGPSPHAWGERLPQS